jgi:hypothetical protein
MAYGLRYTADFDALTTLPKYYTLNIFEDGYLGLPQNITLGSEPAVQEWQDDDPKRPIRGCTLTSEIVNDGNINLSSFYSENDYQFRVELTWNATGEVLFVGYVLQDDCQEVMLDYAHYIKIVATDNLGLIKDITLSEAANLFGNLTTETGIVFQSFGNQLWTNDVRVAGFQAGQQIKITNSIPIYDGTYNILNVSYDSFLLTYKVEVNFTFGIGPSVPGDWSIVTPVDLSGYISLLQVVRLCIKATNIDLGFKVMSEIYPVGGTNQRWLDDCYIRANTFYNNDQWDNCYNVLEAILGRFYATCFQSKGFWWIVRWNEIFKIEANSYLLNGYSYDNDFVYQVPFSEDIRSNISFITGKNVETGILKSIERPLIFNRDTFNFNIDQDLLYNSDLQIVGDLVNTYTSGTDTVLEYNVPWWQPNQANPIPTPDRVIRVIINADNEEVERYIAIYGGGFSAFGALQSQDIFVSQDDVLNYSYEVRTDLSIPGANNVLNCLFELTDGITTYYLDNNGQWQTTFSVFTGGLRLFIVAGDNANQWHNFSVETRGFPIDGVCRVYLGTPGPFGSYSDQTHYKNFSFRLTNNIARNGTVIGQTHTFSQFNNIKNFQKRDILIDNSPRSSIKGTLYLESFTGLIRDRVRSWMYLGQPYVFERLGQLITIEELYSKNVPRYKYIFSLLYTDDSGFAFSNLMILWSSSVYFTDYWMAPGAISIDYKNNVTNVTAIEVASNQIGVDPWPIFNQFYSQRLYEFRYLYEN